MKTPLPLIFGLTIIFLSSCAKPEGQVHLDASEKIRKSLEKAESVYVYEGLPHRFDYALLEAEKKREDTTSIGSHMFYTPKVATKRDVGTSLKKIISSSGSIVAFSGEKKCGGFHPDYAVAWPMEGEENTAMICYGCQEVIFIDAEEEFRYDLKRAALLDIKKLLSSFESKRPKGKR